MTASSPRPAEGVPTQSRALVDAAFLLLRPWRWLTEPACFGMEHVPAAGRVLLVANHTIMGVFDTPVLAAEIYARRGRMIRGLADRLHFAVPLWGAMLAQLGAVLGTRAAAVALLEAEEAVLVFPGGGREVMKRRGEKYRLLWGDRVGFAHVAIATGTPIVPLAMVGGEEFFDILADADDAVLTLPRLAMRALAGRDEVPPIVAGLGGLPLPVPRPGRLYFAFGRPIPTDDWAGRADPAACRAVRDLARAAVEERIAFALARRDDDRARAASGR